ncbi:hypothetical protein LJC45_05355 [Alistipes sp. OttesenSCG-928-B03]|nr:hypothetical protein [Alistipes sp. OttesenSCG-928-B03]
MVKFLLILVFGSSLLYCRDEPKKVNLVNDGSHYDSITGLHVFYITESMPYYSDKETSFSQDMGRYLMNNFTYESADDHIFSFDIAFVIDKKGNLVGQRIMDKKEVDLTAVEKRLLYVLGKMSKWHPGIHNGEKVAVLLRVPISFHPKE